MTIYWALLIFSCLFYPVCTIVYNRRHKLGDFRPVENKNIKAYFICVSICMIAIIGLRSVTVGIDSWNYFYMFSDVRYKDFSFILEPDVREKGYIFLEILAHKAHLGFAGFNLVYAIFNVSVISYLIYKKSSIPWLSYFIYMCFEFFVLQMTMIRQSLAMSVVILAVVLDKNENFLDFLKFAVLIFLANTIHSSAIIALPIWFLKKIPMNNRTIIVTLFCVCIAYLSKSELAELLHAAAGKLSEHYTMYSDIESGNAGNRLYLMTVVTIAPGLLIKRFQRAEGNAFVFYCLCAMLLIFPAVQGGGALMRAYYYFYIFLIIYVPNLITALDAKKDGKIKILIAVLYVAVGIYMFYGALTGNGMKIVPYKFYWQPLN